MFIGFCRFLEVLALFHNVFGGFYGDFHGLIWELLALFHSVFAFQVFSVAHIPINLYESLIKPNKAL